MASDTYPEKRRPAPPRPPSPSINVTDTTTLETEPLLEGRQTPPPEYSTIAISYGENSHTQSGEEKKAGNGGLLLLYTFYKWWIALH